MSAEPFVGVIACINARGASRPAVDKKDKITLQYVHCRSKDAVNLPIGLIFYILIAHGWHEL
jgi:hypothetical protein